MKLSGAQITIETLIEQGTKFVFGYPGGQVINLYDAIYEADDRIHHILTAHGRRSCSCGRWICPKQWQCWCCDGDK